MSQVQVLQGFTFEIHGLVQGVCFRTYTQQEAIRLGLSGWVANTRRNTVIGQVWIRTEGPRNAHVQSHKRLHEYETREGDMNQKLREMKNWLTHIGSPHCRIDHASFKPLPMDAGSDLDQLYPGHARFQIRPTYP